MKLGPHGEYHLTRGGIRPRLRYTRRLTPTCALRRLQQWAQIAEVRAKLRQALARVGLPCDEGTFGAVLEQAIAKEKLHLYREFLLSPAFGTGPCVDLSDLVEDDPQQEEVPTPEPRPVWIALELRGPEGERYPGARMRVQLAAGRTVETRLDETSSWRSDEVPRAGTCRAWLLELGEPQRAPHPPRSAEEGIKIVESGSPVTLTTEAHHLLVVALPGPPVRLRLQRFSWVPFAGRRVELEGTAGPASINADDTGLVAFETLPDAKRTSISVERWGYILDVDALPPVSSEEGWHARLENLGYDPGPWEGRALDAYAQRRSVEEFQCEHGLAVDGIAGPATQAKLVEAHGD